MRNIYIPVSVSVSVLIRLHRGQKIIKAFRYFLVIFIEICGSVFLIGGGIILLIAALVKSKLDGLKSLKHGFA